MSIVVLNNVSLKLGTTQILDAANWQIENNSRTALLGRNGAGKSSLLQLLLGNLTPDTGSLQFANSIRVSGLSQDVNSLNDKSVYASLVSGLGDTGIALANFRYYSLKKDDLKLVDFQTQIDDLQAWDLIPKVENIATRLDIDIDANMQSLSGGMRRRVLLAAAIIIEPQLLLLDEPTNHLDINSIEWLSAYLNNYPGSILFVTHDRDFLQEVASQIVEIDRGKLYTYNCSYEKYLDRREALLLCEQKQNDLFDKRLQIEEAWIRQGIKARRTRNEGRVRKLIKMRKEHQNRREALGKAKSMNINVSSASKLILEAKNISYQIDKQEIIKDFSFLLTKGDKVGIIGPNGCGKSTLVKLLIKELHPDSGELKSAENIQVAYFDQLRSQLDLTKNVLENVGEGATHVFVNGKQKHVASYLQDFLFPKERLSTKVSLLSGGERNRLLLAKLFAKPVNLIVLDEPTNDLDLETLELLENMLVDYTGTLLLISHDRKFIDQVVTSVLVFAGDGQFNEYVGSYVDYKQQLKAKKAKPAKSQKNKVATPTPAKKLTYNEQRELDKLPDKIDELETTISEYQQKMLSKDFYSQDAKAISEFKNSLSQLEDQLTSLYARWEYLDK